MQEIERSEVNPYSMGGTELMQMKLHACLDEKVLDKVQIIASRVRKLEKNKKHILWLHDLPTDGEAKHLKSEESRKRFDKLVFVSHWQMQMYNMILGVTYKESIVMRNSIVPIDIKEKKYDGTVRLIYHTTPHRGLEILVPVFEELVKHYPVELDVYSSFNLYGWPEKDELFKEAIERCKSHPKINYHGAVHNDEVREALKRSHIFAYPSIWPETSCISAIEAMSAKNIVVCPNYAALPETTAGYADMYQWTEDIKEHAFRFANNVGMAIEGVMNGKSQHQDRLNFQKYYFDVQYDWRYVQETWKSFLNHLLDN